MPEHTSSAHSFPAPAELVRQLIAGPAPDGWQPTGMDRSFYLDVVERIVRMAYVWIDADGAVIDPVQHFEVSQTSPRFASSCAVLMRFGRCLVFMEPLCRVLDHCCAVLKSPDSVEHSPDFWMRELATACSCLEGIVPEARLNGWRSALAQVIPEKNYRFVSSNPADRHMFHNWAVYAAAGESMRESAGISGPSDALWGERFFDAYVRHQLWRFDGYGMYRDPDDPITYDITTRLQFEAALASGYGGIWRDGLRTILDDAMMATLLFVAPTGEVPFGGRSSQFQFQEGIVSALCELAAARCRDTNPRLAGAFKRQAHLSASSIRPWIFRDDGKLFALKNCFPPETRHGCDGYGHYAVYNLYAASVFSLAALYSDDSIPEAPAPAEIGGFFFPLLDSFRKLFCNCSGNYLEFDLRPNPRHDACGLGRIFLKGLPRGILPALPFPVEPHYTISDSLPKNTFPAAVAPEWTDSNGTVYRLASLEGEGAECSQIQSGIWEVVYHAWNTAVTYRADIRKAGELVLDVTLDGDAKAPALILPLLAFDGEKRLKTPEERKLTLETNGGNPVSDGTAVNRTGLYERLRFPFPEKGPLHLAIKAKETL